MPMAMRRHGELPARVTSRAPRGWAALRGTLLGTLKNSKHIIAKHSVPERAHTEKDIDTQTHAT